MSFYQIRKNPVNYVQKDASVNFNQTISFLKDGFLQPSSIYPENTISGTGVTYTTTQLLYKYLVRNNLGSSTSDTTPTAAQIVAALNQNPAVETNNQQQSYIYNSNAQTYPQKTVQAGFYFDWMVTNTDTNNNNLQIVGGNGVTINFPITCLLYTSPSPRDGLLSRMPSSA